MNIIYFIRVSRAMETKFHIYNFSVQYAMNMTEDSLFLTHMAS
jgi:hypothetical protein